MSDPISLRSAERKAFQSTVNDGLWDVFIGCFFLEFALAPLLSTSMGDFWSSVIFLPFFGLMYLLIHLVRKVVVAPRIGSVVPGPPRQKKLRKLSLVLVILNLAIFILGLAAYWWFDRFSLGVLLATLLGLFTMAGFCLAAYYLDYARLYVYGSLLMIAPLVGEWLYMEHGAVHHGYPLVFGFTSLLMILVGLITFIRLLIKHPRLEIPDGN